MGLTLTWVEKDVGQASDYCHEHDSRHDPVMWCSIDFHSNFRRTSAFGLEARFGAGDVDQIGRRASTFRNQHGGQIFPEFRDQARGLPLQRGDEFRFHGDTIVSHEAWGQGIQRQCILCIAPDYPFPR